MDEIEFKINELQRTILFLNTELTFLRKKLNNEKKKNIYQNVDNNPYIAPSYDDPNAFKEWYENLHLY